MSWKFHWLTKWDEIWNEGFVSQWMRWLDESPSAHVFFHPALVRAWVETYMPLRDIRPCFLIAEASGQTVFFPLVLWRQNWKNAFRRILIPMGYVDYDYHDPIIVGTSSSKIEEDFWVAFLNEVKKRIGGTFDLLFVDGLHNLPQAGNNHTSIKEVSPFFNLRKFNSVDDVIQSLSKRTREDVRRKRHKLEQMGDVHFHSFSSDNIATALTRLPLILSEHSKKWPDSFKAPSFHEQLVRNSLSSGLLHMTELSFNGVPISWHIGFLYKARYYWYMPAYKSEFGKFSPGQTHLFMCVEDALRKGAEIFDFLRGNEVYKTHLAQESDELFELRCSSNKLLSSVRNFLSDSIKPGMKKILGK